jgi:hypothetical protein
MHQHLSLSLDVQSSSLSRVPSFEELPEVAESPRVTEVELATVTVEPHPHFAGYETTEIQLVYEEQRQIFEAEHASDLQPAVCSCI